MAGAHADISKHIKVYIMVFAALAIGTVITVTASRVDFGGHVNVALALMIAAIKATLVAAIFMHLKWERSMWIWCSLGFCAIFFVFLIALPVLTTNDHPALTRHGPWDVTPEEQVQGHTGDGHAPGH